ncbi:hypothetical protein [Massilia sp. METH4]|uniref:hypothetical protein n=1 Tax=Massilia sp. METH4 TaxID=3123041 RepID=UPI0030D2543A
MDRGAGDTPAPHSTSASAPFDATHLGEGKADDFIAPALEPAAARRRGLALSLLFGTVILLLVFAAFALVRQFEAERTLHEVARAAAVPPTAPANVLAGGQGGDASMRADAVPVASTASTASTGDGAPAQAIPPVATVPPGQDMAAAAQSLAPAAAAMAVGSGAAVAAAVNPGRAGAPMPERDGADARADTAGTRLAREGGSFEEGRHTTARAMEQAAKQAAKGSAVQPAKGAAKQSGKSSVKRARAAAERRSARRFARDETFKRCPPLGRKGAVTCRVHICNGGAGKERACRPYLERSP